MCDAGDIVRRQDQLDRGEGLIGLLGDVLACGHEIVQRALLGDDARRRPPLLAQQRIFRIAGAELNQVDAGKPHRFKPRLGRLPHRGHAIHANPRHHLALVCLVQRQFSDLADLDAIEAHLAAFLQTAHRPVEDDVISCEIGVELRPRQP